jgi:hypothetical protein
MNPVTQKEIKELTGLSKQFISRECGKNKLTMCEHNGKRMVDLDGHFTIEWLRRHRPKTNEQPPPKIPIQDKINFDLINSNSNNPSGLPGSNESTKLKEIKLQEQIEELRIKNQQKRGALISKKIVVKVFNRIYNIDESQFKSIGVNVSPKISAVYNNGNSEKADLLIAYFKENSNPEKSDIAKILNSGEPLRINEMNQILEDTTGAILKGVQREITSFLEKMEPNGK